MRFPIWARSWYPKCSCCRCANSCERSTCSVRWPHVERGVPAEARAHRGDDAEREDHRAPLQDDRGCRRASKPSSIAAAAASGITILAPTHTVDDREPDRDPPPRALGGAATTIRRPPRRSSGERTAAGGRSGRARHVSAREGDRRRTRCEAAPVADLVHTSRSTCTSSRFLPHRGDDSVRGDGLTLQARPAELARHAERCDRPCPRATRAAGSAATTTAGCPCRTRPGSRPASRLRRPCGSG